MHGDISTLSGHRRTVELGMFINGTNLPLAGADKGPSMEFEVASCNNHTFMSIVVKPSSLIEEREIKDFASETGIATTTDQTCSESQSAPPVQEYRVYGRRWAGLFAFVSFAHSCVEIN